MSDDYTPPRVWKWDKDNGGKFASINRPIAGPTHDRDLPVGTHHRFRGSGHGGDP